MFAVGALDAYFCDAYTDVVAATIIATLTAARAQTMAATAALDLAQTELDQAEVRFEAQIATQSDVIIGQTNLAGARTAQVDSWFALKCAEIEFKRATGVTF